jgi:hypothetical protein
MYCLLYHNFFDPQPNTNQLIIITYFARSINPPTGLDGLFCVGEEEGARGEGTMADG